MTAPARADGLETESAGPAVATVEPVQGAAPTALGGHAAPGAGSRLTRADVLRLQRSAGNAAVATLLRARSAPAAEEAPAGAAPIEQELEPPGAEEAANAAPGAEAELPPAGRARGVRERSARSGAGGRGRSRR